MKFKYEIYAEVYPLMHDGNMDHKGKIAFYRSYSNIIFAYVYHYYLLKRLKKYIFDKNFFVKLPTIHVCKEL